MQNDCRGMTAFVDAIVFILVIMLALSVTGHNILDDQEDYPNASVFLDAVYATSILSSDISSVEYDVTTDLMYMVAYSMVTGDPGPMEYLRELMEVHCRGHGYMMEMTYGGLSEVIETGDGTPRSSAERSIRIEGEELWMRFTLKS